MSGVERDDGRRRRGGGERSWRGGRPRLVHRERGVERDKREASKWTRRGEMEGREARGGEARRGHGKATEGRRGAAPGLRPNVVQARAVQESVNGFFTRPAV